MNITILFSLILSTHQKTTGLPIHEWWSSVRDVRPEGASNWYDGFGRWAPCGQTQQEIFRVYLKNGNYLDGISVKESTEGVRLDLPNGEMFIPRDYIDPVKKIQKIKIKANVQKKEEPIKTPDNKEPVNGKKPETPDKPTTEQPKEKVFSKEIVNKVESVLREFEEVSDLEKPQVVDKLIKIGEEGALYLVSKLDKLDVSLLPWMANLFVGLNSQAVGEELVKKLQGENTRMKYVAVNVLTSVKFKGVDTHIRALFKEKDPNLRITAINALLTLRSKESVTDIISLMRDKDSGVRKSAGFALIKFANEVGMHADVAGRLLEIIDTSSEKEAVEMAFVLGEIKARDAVPKLIVLLDKDEESTRAQALIALGKIKDKKAIPAISARATVENSRQVKIQIAWALEQIKDDSGTPVLLNMLLDEDSEVKAAALRSLVNMYNEARLGDSYDAWIDWWNKRKR